jgi:hypothetical protein
MKPLPQDRGYDIVLLDQGYRTPRGAVIDEYEAMVNDDSHGKKKTLERNLP